MALVIEFVKVPAKSGRRQSTTVGEWFMAERDGQRVVQLDTGGSTDRANPGKTSQTLQFDRAAAAQLVRILRDAFGDQLDT